MTTAAPLPKISGLIDYELVQLLGEGGMGKVFLAKSQRSGQVAVVKLMHANLLKDAKSRQRFQQETDLMRRFRHPNAVAFLGASNAGVEQPFIIMEYVRGITLDDHLNQHGRLAPLRAGKLLAQLCLFLQVAHGNGLLHRDLTPVNIMIVDADTPREKVKVMDFGLARQIGFYIPTGQIDRNSSAIDGGTPDFICPEQIQGRQVDHRGDLYSVGTLLYMLLTGYVPFENLKEPGDILRANLYEQVPRFSHWGVTDVPAAIEGLVLACLSKSPEQRPDSARTLIETYQLALGCRLVDDRSFASSEQSAVSSLHERHRFDPRDVIDRFEASMVEQMAAMKLRGFVDGVGGQVVDSDAGVIKVRLPMIVELPPKKGGWNWFNTAPTQQIEWIDLELHMAKKQVGTRSLVSITVVRSHVKGTAEQKKFCEEICRELRAYLMVER